MKKPLLWLGLLALPASALGQGFVNFANTSSTLFITNGSVCGQGVGPISGVNAFRVGLYVAPDGSTLESAFTLAAVATNSAIAAGRFSFSGNPFAVNPAGPTEGNPIAFQVKAWSSYAGNTFDEAINYVQFGGFAYGGKSAIGRVTPATGINPAPTLFGTGEFSGQLTSGIVLVPALINCPEPTVYALAILGAALGGLLLRPRRRNDNETGKDTLR